MNTKIYLADYVIRELEQYGPIDKVIAYLVDRAMQDISLWPDNDVEIPQRSDNDKQVYITIDNPAYEQYKLDYGRKATSIRRLIVYLVEYGLIPEDMPSFDGTIVNKEYIDLVDISYRLSKYIVKYKANELVDSAIMIEKYMEEIK